MIEVVGVDLGLRKAHTVAVHDDGHLDLFDVQVPKCQRRDIELKEINQLDY